MGGRIIDDIEDKEDKEDKKDRLTKGELKILEEIAKEIINEGAAPKKKKKKKKKRNQMKNMKL